MGRVDPFRHHESQCNFSSKFPKISTKIIFWIALYEYYFQHQPKKRLKCLLTLSRTLLKRIQQLMIAQTSTAK